MPTLETRVYPICCTSAYCGRGPASCPSCVNYPTLKAFKQWRDETDAKPADEIWSPLVYQGVAKD